MLTQKKLQLLALGLMRWDAKGKTYELTQAGEDWLAREALFTREALFRYKCVDCGDNIAPALARLGSLRCHECRGELWGAQ